jgi:Family of unknown function (DUF6261)
MNFPKFSYIHVIDKAAAIKSMGKIINELYPNENTLNVLLDKCIEVADNVISGTQDQHLKNMTIEVEKGDIVRDNIFRSVYYALKSASLNPYHPDKIEAADRILIKVFNDKLAVINLPFGIESVQIEEKVNLLLGEFSVDVETTKIGELVLELKKSNEDFNVIYANRSTEIEKIPESYGSFNTDINKTLKVLCGYISMTMTEKAAETLFDPLNRVERRTN